MPITLLHISDAHFGSGQSPKPVDRVLAAIRGLNIDPSSIALVLTGDVAFSGKAAEYDNAESYFSGLYKSLAEEFHVPCKIIVSPGNHDCSYPKDTAVRDLVIQDIRSKGVLPESAEIIKQCTSVQDPFFEWVNRLDPQLAIPNHRLAWTTELTDTDGTKIIFRVINTAWMSTIHEEQGNLFYPTSILPELPAADVRISLLHHPYYWFNSSNGRELRRILEETSDLVLTGHEHDYDEYTKTRKPSETTGYVEAGLFCNNDETVFSFNVIQIDLPNSRYSVFPFTWHKDLFTVDTDQIVWHSFVFKSSSVFRENMLSNEMRNFIEDPGLQLTHRAKSLTLEDIFIPPDLKTYGHFEKPEQMENGSIPSNETINRLFEDRFAYIVGEAQCGKTSLGKILFIQSLRRGFIPIL